VGRGGIDLEGPAEGFVRVVYVDDKVSTSERQLVHSRFRVYDVPAAKFPQFERSKDPSQWLQEHARFRYADAGRFDVIGGA
jgi:hypothetical protein